MYRRTILIVVWMMLAAVSAVAEPLQNRPTRQVDMEGYTVISDASDKEIVSWVKDFDRMRRAGQQIIGVTDDQLLPLTVLLFAKRMDFWGVLPPASRSRAVISVGLDQQPVIALDVEGDRNEKDMSMRFAVLMWLMGSTGLNHDRWVLQGMNDLFATIGMNENSIVVGKRAPAMISYLKSGLKQNGGIPFSLSPQQLPPAVDWLAVHYLVIGEHGWQGLDGITQYQRRVALGEPRSLAFKGVFGLSAEQAAVAMETYYRKRRIKEVKLPWERPPTHDRVVLREADPGLRELCLARLVLQLPGSYYEEARRLTDVAAEARPDDVRVQENLVLYGVRTNQPVVVATALARALAMGTRNHALRLQWCVDTISQGFNRSGGFMLPPDQATLVADTLHELLRSNANRVVVYILMAQIMPSMPTARRQDRALLEAGRSAMPTRSALVRVGLAAWMWRDGQRTTALKTVQAMLAGEQLGAQAELYAKWLEAQLQAEELAEHIDECIASGDFNEVRKRLNAYKTAYPLISALKDRINAQYFVAGQEEMLARAERVMAEGESQQARLLLGTIPVAKLPASLQARAKALAEQLNQPVSPANGTSE